MDADGDFIVSYQGHGPDSSVTVNMTYRYFEGFFALDPANPGHRYNEDLLPYFNPLSPPPATNLQEGLPVAGQTLDAYSDVDGVIDQVLFRAQFETVPAATAEQLGRLRAILESGAGALRGDSNGALLSRWDADPQLGTIHPTYTDSIANSQRDGQNQRMYIEIPGTIESGTFTIRVTLPDGNFRDVNATIVGTGQFAPINAVATSNSIEAALQQLGVNWPDPQKGGIVNIRQVQQAEVLGRVGTPWDVPIDPTAMDENGPSPAFNVPPEHAAVLYEVVFQGELHDVPIGLAVIASHTRFWTVRPGQGDTPPTNVEVDSPGVPATMQGDYAGFQGTSQYDTSLGMTPDGSLVTTYTQQELATNGIAPTNSAGEDIYQNIYYRQFQESTDTAGPRITQWTDATGNHLKDGYVFTQGSVQYLVLTFDEDMLTTGDDSVTNPANYKLFYRDAALPNGIVNVQYGLSKAAELATADGLNPIPSGKWEAVLTLDSDPNTAGNQPLSDGSYQLVVQHAVPGTTSAPGQSGLRDANGTPLSASGFVVGGADFVRNFRVKIGEVQDTPVDPGTGSGGGAYFTNGHTDPESPRAVAFDANGRHVVVWTGTDAAGHNRVFVSLFDADGSAVDLPSVQWDAPSQKWVPVLGPGGVPVVVPNAGRSFAVTPSPDFPTFATDEQTNATAACDADGDFVVTWTNTRNGNADIYARRFSATGDILGVDTSNGNIIFSPTLSTPFRVNTYTTNAQKWSSVAMDPMGDFVITWSSNGQEDNGQMGMGYGVYARRYDSFGQAQGQEFRVNVTTAGNQRMSNVAMDSQGGFLDRLDQQPGRHGRRLLPQLLCRRHALRRSVGWRDPRQRDHRRRSAVSRRRHGPCRRPIRRVVGFLGAGRQRLGRLQPALQSHQRLRRLHQRQRQSADPRPELGHFEPGRGQQRDHSRLERQPGTPPPLALRLADLVDQPDGYGGPTDRPGSQASRERIVAQRRRLLRHRFGRSGGHQHQQQRCRRGAAVRGQLYPPAAALRLQRPERQRHLAIANHRPRRQ